MFTAGVLLALLAAPAAFDAADVRPASGRAASDRQGTAPQETEVVDGIRIQGNVLTPDDEILRLAGVSVGSRLGDATLTDAAARLEASRKFEHVEVLKRFASLDDPTRILIVIIVDEGPVRIERTGDPDHPVRVVRAGRPLMVLPLFDFEDGYGASYGARFTRPEVAGAGSRLSFPFTWGGTRRAAVEFSKRFDAASATTVEAGAAASRRTNPFFHADDSRTGVWARAERPLVPHVRLGGGVAWQHVSFLDARDDLVDAGADVTIDTRVDPVLARNAVFFRAGLNAVSAGSRTTTVRSSLEARGYLGTIGQTVLIAAAHVERANGALPPYLKPLLGGPSSVRGFRTGMDAGDDLVAASMEWRVPLTSPLALGKIGVSAFVDAGAVASEGQALLDQAFRTGAGGSVWMSMAFVRLSVSVAHGIGASTRVHVVSALTF